jgi:predicted KAP-like P-loop ATPase
MFAHSSEIWFRKRRICHPEIFDKYFTLTIADGDLSQAEIDDFLNATGNTETFVLSCKAFKVRGLLEKAFQRLDTFKDEIPLQNMPSLIEGLCGMSDEFPERKPVLSGRGVDVYAWRLVFFGLKREPDSAIRLQILKKAFLNSMNLALPIQIVSMEASKENRAELDCEYLVDDEGLKQLKAICVDKLRVASKTAQFLQAPRLLDFLWRWSEWTSDNEVRDWLSDCTKDERGAIWLLSLLLSVTHSYGVTHRIGYHIALDTVEKFSDTKMLIQLVQNVDADKLPQREGIAVREFRKALKRREEGRPDDAGRHEGIEVEANE